VLGLFLLLVLIRGGNTDFAMNVAVVLAVVLTTIGAPHFIFRARHGRHPTLPALLIVIALLSVLIMGVIALQPLTVDSWLRLPGRAAYAPITSLLTRPEFAFAQLTLSIDPVGTKRAIVAVLPCIAIAAVTAVLTRQSLMWVLGAFAVLATGEALMGLAQLGSRGAAQFVIEYAGHTRASGTFVNKNHYATLLAMALPILVFRSAGLFSFFFGRGRPAPLSNALWGIATATVAAALVASLSRAGVLAGGIVASIAVAACTLRPEVRTRRRLIIAGLLVLVAVVLAAMVGLGQLVRSFAQEAFGGGASSRTVMNAHTWTGIVAFFPLGAGLGSYAIAFQRFQTPALTGFVEYAHNDYLQLIFETGVFGVAILALLAAAAWLAARPLWREIRATGRLSPAVASFLGATAFAIHAAFDFPAHIPALAFIATFLFSASTNRSLAEVGTRKVVSNPRTVHSRRSHLQTPSGAQSPKMSSTAI